MPAIPDRSQCMSRYGEQKNKVVVLVAMAYSPVPRCLGQSVPIT